MLHNAVHPHFHDSSIYMGSMAWDNVIFPSFHYLYHLYAGGRGGAGANPCWHWARCWSHLHQRIAGLFLLCCDVSSEKCREDPSHQDCTVVAQDSSNNVPPMRFLKIKISFRITNVNCSQGCEASLERRVMRGNRNVHRGILTPSRLTGIWTCKCWADDTALY